MRLLTLIILMLLSLPILMPEPQSLPEVSKGIGDKLEAPVELPIKGVDEEELHCMTLALYKESRGEPERGSILVSQVIMNRVQSKKFSNSVCSVVKKKLAGNCMFSFWCHPNREKINDIESYKRLTEIAYNAILGKYKGVTTSTFFKVCSVKSKFFDKLRYKGRIGNHCFYEEY